MSELREKIQAIVDEITSKPMAVGEPEETIHIVQLQIADELRAALRQAKVDSEPPPTVKPVCVCDHCKLANYLTKQREEQIEKGESQ